MILLFLSLRSQPPERARQSKSVVHLSLAARHAWPRRFVDHLCRCASSCRSTFSQKNNLFVRLINADRPLLTLLPCVRPLGCNAPRRDRIISSTRERIATQDPPTSQSRSIEQTVLCHGFRCVFRTTGNKAAGGREIRRNGALINPQE